MEMIDTMIGGIGRSIGHDKAVLMLRPAAFLFRERISLNDSDLSGLVLREI